VTDPLAALDRAREAITALPDAEVRCVLAAAVGALLAGEDARPALGLDGGRYAQLRQARRNYHLRNAAALLGERTPWLQAKALRRQAALFEGTVWPRWREKDSPPPTASPLQVELWRARKAWRFPNTPMMYSNIIGEGDE
jgi:hypothetical protein